MTAVDLSNFFDTSGGLHALLLSWRDYSIAAGLLPGTHSHGAPRPPKPRKCPLLTAATPVKAAPHKAPGPIDNSGRNPDSCASQIELCNEVVSVANSAQARKRARQNDKRRVHNHSIRSRMRTMIKAFVKSAGAGDKDAATSAYRSAVAMIDKLAGKGLQHKNRAARLKSRLNNRLRGIG